MKERPLEIPGSNEFNNIPTPEKPTLIDKVISFFNPKDDDNTYQNTINYNKSVDSFDNGRYDKDHGFTIKDSRLGNLGLTKEGDHYILRDSKGNIVKQCAATVNDLQRMLQGQTLSGNAWNSKGEYGETVLYNGYTPKPNIKYNPVVSFGHNLIAGINMSRNFDDIDFQTGDVVSLYSTNSDYNDEAWNYGTDNRANSHTGMVFRPDPKRKDQTYVIHNVLGNVSVEPLANFQLRTDNLTPDWLLTRAVRPNARPKNETDNTHNGLPVMDSSYGVDQGIYKKGGKLIPKGQNGLMFSFFKSLGLNDKQIKSIKLPGKAINSKGQLTNECAEYLNSVLRKNGINSWGNAYAVNKQFKTFYNGYNKVSKPKTTNRENILNMHKAAADNLKANMDTTQLNPNHVYTANMYYSTSPHMIDFYQAASKHNTGTYGTHTGLLYHNPAADQWQVSHNIHGTVHNDALKDIMGGKSNPNKYGVTAIADAGAITTANDYDWFDPRKYIKTLR